MCLESNGERKSLNLVSSKPRSSESRLNNKEAAGTRPTAQTRLGIIEPDNNNNNNNNNNKYFYHKYNNNNSDSNNNPDIIIRLLLIVIQIIQIIIITEVGP